MQEITIISKKARQRAKEPIVIPLKAWEQMDPALKRKFNVVNTIAPPSDETIKKKRIEDLAAKVSATPKRSEPKTDTDFTALLRDYKKIAKTDKEAAKILLEKLIDISPANEFLQKEMLKYK